MSEEEMRMQASARQRHNVNILGRGSKTLVFSHGFGTNQSIWEFIMPYFDLKKYRIVLFDLMGACSTDASHFDYTRYSSLHGFADDLLDILFELKIEKCDFIGHSVSGIIGLLASIEAPERFEQIILLGASPRYINSSDFVGGFNLEDLDEFFARMHTNYKTWATGFGEMLIGDTSRSKKVREYCSTLYLMRPDIAIHIAKTIFKSDMRSILHLVTVPVHLLQTAFDAAVPLKVAEFMLQRIPSVLCLDLLPVGGHIPHLTSPEIVGPAILRHLSQKCSKRGLHRLKEDNKDF